MTLALINPIMLSWARERAGFAVPDFARKMGKTSDTLLAWEAGSRPLTFNQAMQFADKAYVPFGYLFLTQPPADEFPIPDLRTVDSGGVRQPSAELLDLVKQMQERQEWYKEYLAEQGESGSQVVGRKTTQDSVANIVEYMRQQLGVSAHPQRNDWEDYYRDLVKRIEELGIMVMRLPYLGSYHRRFRVEEFRGFAMADAIAPLLFVNHADAPGARLFTLIHEFCHILLGQSGVSDGDANTQNKIEVLCNAVAAEFLVPEVEFRQKWDTSFEDWRDNLCPLEAHFHVSTWALARRALTLGFISQVDYSNYILAQRKAHDDRERTGGSGGYYKNQKSWLSDRFSRAVTSQALNGQMMLRDAGHLLNMSAANVVKFAKEVGI
jgi:Zn-dependent peptidase ImmA (M78 family)